MAKTVHPRKVSGGTEEKLIRIVCALFFCAFTFLYLYFISAEMIAVAQHILSGGMTHYNRIIGAVLTTAILLVLQIFISGITHKGLMTYALTFFPSMLILAMISCIVNHTISGEAIIPYALTAVIALVIWALIMLIASKVPVLEPSSTGFFSMPMWVNLLIMILMFIMVGIGTSGKDRDIYRARMEMNLMHGNYIEALETGIKSQTTDGHITMLRMYALSKLGIAADYLFYYPIGGTSEDLVPKVNGSDMLILDQDSIYIHLGAIPREGMTINSYLKAITKSGQATADVGDYILCGLLIDRNLDGFAKELPNYYTINDSLPLHYREALTLYIHTSANTSLEYNDSLMNDDFLNMLRIEGQYESREQAAQPIYEQYKGTYWYYYNYQ